MKTDRSLIIKRGMTMRAGREIQQPKRNYRTFKMLLIFILVLIIAIAAAAAYSYKSAKDSLDISFTEKTPQLEAGGEYAAMDFVKDSEGEVVPSAEFLNAVQPRFAIISVDIENSSNLPSNDTIERLQASGVQKGNILQTTQGSIVFSVVNDELTYVIQPEINLFHSNHSLALSSIFAFVIILLCCAFVGKPYKIPLFECRPL